MERPRVRTAGMPGRGKHLISGLDKANFNTAAGRDPALVAGDRAVLRELVHHCNSKTLQCDPSKETIAALTGLTPRYVQKRVQSLAAQNWLYIGRNAGRRERCSRE